MTPIAVRILALAAAAFLALAGGFAYWRSAQKPAASALIAPPPSGASGPAPQAAAPPAAESEPPQATAALPPPPIVEPGASAPLGEIKRPEFDIVRVTPSGEAVIAGRAMPGARVEMLDGDKVVATEKADENGQFVVLPPALATGDHLLALRVTPDDGAPVTSAQNVTVAVRPGTGPVVTLAEPGKPSVVLAAPAAPPAAPPPSGSLAVRSAGIEALPPGSAQITIKTAEVEAGGRFFATGTAPADSTVRLYLNGTHVADAGTAADGKWSLTIAKGFAGGKYALRADAVDAQGRVVSRAEVPFEGPALLAAAPPSAAARQSSSAPAAEVRLANRGPALPPPETGYSSPDLNQERPGNVGSIREALPGGLAAGTKPIAATAPKTVTVGEGKQGGAGLAAKSIQGASRETSLASSAPQADAVVPEISTATVSRGDSLWRISRQRLGRGIRYTVIYEANASQIRDPSRIYPGQVFVMPPN